ncbi:MAG TPA: hypothetical protein VIM11_07455 [Tepidisphaeraceae bacterium]|jgi:hypothetical protein
MTNNQRRAIALASEIRRGATDASDLPEHDWHLLLLAAGLNSSSAPARLIAARVLNNAQGHVLYFAESTGIRSSFLQTATW